GAADLFVDDPVVEVGEPGAVLLVGQEEVPEAGPLRLLADPDEDLGEGRLRVDLAVEPPFDLHLPRVDVLVHELPPPGGELLGAVARLEVHLLAPRRRWSKVARLGPGRARLAEARPAPVEEGAEALLRVGAFPPPPPCPRLVGESGQRRGVEGGAGELLDRADRLGRARRQLGAE